MLTLKAAVSNVTLLCFLEQIVNNNDVHGPEGFLSYRMQVLVADRFLAFVALA